MKNKEMAVAETYESKILHLAKSQDLPYGY